MGLGPGEKLAAENEATINYSKRRDTRNCFLFGYRDFRQRADFAAAPLRAPAQLRCVPPWMAAGQAALGAVRGPGSPNPPPARLVRRLWEHPTNRAARRRQKDTSREPKCLQIAAIDSQNLQHSMAKTCLGRTQPPGFLGQIPASYRHRSIYPDHSYLPTYTEPQRLLCTFSLTNRWPIFCTRELKPRYHESGSNPGRWSLNLPRNVTKANVQERARYEA